MHLVIYMPLAYFRTSKANKFVLTTEKLTFLLIIFNKSNKSCNVFSVIKISNMKNICLEKLLGATFISYTDYNFKRRFLIIKKV